MNLNYIILAHNNPLHLLRLVNKLDSSESNFYIHIDASVDMEEFKVLLQPKINCIFLDGNKRQYTKWGGIDMVKATLNAIDQIILDDRRGYTILLSGQDYPIKSNLFIQRFFQEKYGTNFIESFSLPVLAEDIVNIHGGLDRSTWVHVERGASGRIGRLNNYTFFFSNVRGDYATIPPIFSKRFFLNYKNIRYLIGLLRRKPTYLKHLFYERKFPKNFKAYGGSQWWALPYETIVFIKEYNKSNREFINYNEFTLVPDEIFFQTLVANNFQNISSPVTYVNFVKPTGPKPAIFTILDQQELMSSPCLFARKFSSSLDSEILNKIDDFTR